MISRRLTGNMPFAGTAAIAILVVSQGIGNGQTDINKFDVASIKPSQPNARNAGAVSPGSFNFNTSAKTLILMAYKIKEYQLSGWPKWMDSDYYQVTAKAPDEPAPLDQQAGMALTSERLKNLLAERFQLSVHHVTSQMNEYVLVVAKGGPKLKEVTYDAARFKVLNAGGGRIVTRGGAKLGLLASILVNDVGCPVIDETGLNGYYDLQLTYADTRAKADDPRPSLFAALQEQLGLKLEARKGPVDVVVIDRLERPSEN